MSLRLQAQYDRFDAYQEIDLVALKAGEFKLEISYSYPARLSWKMHAPHQQTPIRRLAFVRFWDDQGTDETGQNQSAANPLFEGFVEETVPDTTGHIVRYVAFDPTRRAANQVPVMSTAWTQGNVSSGTLTPLPTEGNGAVPRIIFNCKIDNDPDYAFSRADDYTVGQIIQTILEDAYQPLYWINAAPGDGTSVGNGSPIQLNSASGTGGTWEIGELDHKPQEKIVFESENLRSAIDRLLSGYEPKHRLLWEPGTRKWRFYDLTAATQQTLTLNDFSGNLKVLSFNLAPSLESCYTAVKVYGPETTLVAAPNGEGDIDAFYTSGSTPGLVALGSGILLQTYTTSTGTYQARAYTQYQVNSVDKRRGAKALSRTVTVPMDDWQFIPVKSPTLQCSWDDGQTWMTAIGTFFDFQNGIANMVNPLYFWVDPAPIPGSTQKFFPPTVVRLVWAYYVDPITVRKPAIGFEGTAYTVAGLESVYTLYDEALAVGYEWGTPVTTATRVAQFEKLAQRLLDERKDIRWTGGATLEGLRYEFLRLNKRINIAAKDANGGALTTGWEAINAWLSDVEYDYDNRVTTLTWSSDQMEMIGESCEQMKQELKIRALEQRAVYQTTYSMERRIQPPVTIMQHDLRKDILSQDGKEITGVYTEMDFVYVDPETGEQG